MNLQGRPDLNGRPQSRHSLACRVVAHGRGGVETDIELETIADGLRARAPGELTFDVNSRSLADVATVSEEDIIDAMRNVPELGFALVSNAHGKGYATEAVRAVLDWGDRYLPSKRTVCLVNEQNLASVRIVERAGYRAFERSTYNDSPVIFLERNPS